MNDGFRVEPLAAAHKRKMFSSGVPALDVYLRERAMQDIKRRVSNCYVALSDQGEIAGYYTLAASSLPLDDLPPEQAKRLPRYGHLPAALIGRLVVDERFRGIGLGGALIFDSIVRAARAEPAIFALVVDSKNDKAASFYERYGFARLASRPASLFLPMASAVGLLDR